MIIESSKEQYLFEIEVFRAIINVTLNSLMNLFQNNTLIKYMY